MSTREVRAAVLVAVRALSGETILLLPLPLVVLLRCSRLKALIITSRHQPSSSGPLFTDTHARTHEQLLAVCFVVAVFRVWVAGKPVVVFVMNAGPLDLTPLKVTGAIGIIEDSSTAFAKWLWR